MHNNASLNVQLLQKETLETFSKSLLSSNNLKTLAKQLADQLSGLDPQRWFQNITHSIGSGTIMLIIILVIVFVIYWCLSTKIVQTKQTHLLRAFFTKVSTVIPNYEKVKKGELSGDIQLWRIQHDIFFFCVPFLKDSVLYQFLENRNKQSCTQFSGLRSWERASAWNPFSDSLQWPFTWR